MSLSSRIVYNKTLALQQENHKAELKYTSYAQMCKKLTTWRKDEDTIWLSRTQTVDVALRADVDSAYEGLTPRSD